MPLWAQNLFGSACYIFLLRQFFLGLPLRASGTDLLRPLIYLQDPALFTLPRGLKVVLDQFGQGSELKWEVEGIATQGRKG